MESVAQLETFRQICRRRGWKCTGQRFAVYRFMDRNPLHPTTDMVREALLDAYPGISRDSVYRILNDLAECGVIARMPQTDPVRFDGNPARNDHFFCRRCGRVLDFTADIPRSALPEAAGRLEKFEVRAYGLCKDCLEIAAGRTE